MRTNRLPTCVASLICASAMLLQISPAMAGDDRNDRPIEVTFTKWIPTGMLLTGVTGGAAAGVFVGEVLETQHSANPEVNPNPDLNPAVNRNGIQRLEAIYAVDAENERRSFTALIRGGQNNVTGAALLDGVILAGWRTGARVHVAFQRYFASDPHCLDAGAPMTANCFVGTIYIERGPRH
jgi:hypothetical protein